METAYLKHKSGGDISRITAIQHETYRGVADWFFVGTVQWHDGGITFDARIPPYSICYDHDNDKGEAECEAVMALLNDYLGRLGAYHKPKHKRDGRVVHWTPRESTGRELID